MPGSTSITIVTVKPVLPNDLVRNVVLGASQVAYEPFSLSTRKTRTTLLVFSTLAVAISQYNVTLENVPGVGFEIPIPEGLLTFVVGVAVLYLTVAFSLYCFDDIKYMSRPESIRDRSQELIDDNANLATRIAELHMLISEVPDPSEITRSTSKTSNESQSTSASVEKNLDISAGRSRSEEISVITTYSGRLAELEDLKAKMDRNNEELRRVRISRATWVRIYILDTTLPLCFGVLANSLLWVRPLFALNM